MNFIKKDNFYLGLIIFIIGFGFNFYYANLGVFPVDSFLHYDSGFKFIANELPLRDYWIVHGLSLDIIQYFFFKIFGVNWVSYLLHSSIFNGVLALFFYRLLTLYSLNYILSFILGILFSILAYPVSGTPFLDLHSTYFSLVSYFIFIYYLKRENPKIFVLIPIFFGLSFFSKQVPATYFIVTFIFFYLFYIFKSKNLITLKYLFYGTFIFLLALFIFLLINKINFSLMFTELFLYPMSIGDERLNSFELNISKIISNYKFIIISIFALAYTMYSVDLNYQKKLICFMLIFFSIILIYHQLMTKNQNFLFFLIPLNASFFILFNQLNFKRKKLLIISTLVICVILTVKYHVRFNEERKFHDLQNTNLKNFIPASYIDESLTFLKWITADYKQDPAKEIKIIKEVKIELDNNTENKLLISNYLFLDAITQNKIFSISRTFDDISFPSKKNKYYNFYKDFFIKKLKKNNIKKIYVFFNKNEINGAMDKYVFSYISSDCFKIYKKHEELIELTLIDGCI